MIIKHLLAFLVVCSVSANSSNISDVPPGGNCSEIAAIMKKVVSAKVEYEKELYLKKLNLKSYKQRYMNLMKLFKQSDKIDSRKECLKQLITKDSISPVDTVVVFSYKAPISSNYDICDMMLNSYFLKTMLMNLDYANNDSALICDPQLVKNRN